MLRRRASQAAYYSVRSGGIVTARREPKHSGFNTEYVTAARALSANRFLDLVHEGEEKGGLIVPRSTHETVHLLRDSSWGKQGLHSSEVRFLFSLCAS